MATKYTSVVNIQGNSRRRYRGYVSATVSNVDNDTSRITWSARVEMYNAAQYGVGVKCYVGGTLRKTDTGYLSSSPGTSYKTVASVSGTTDYTRGTSAKSVTVTVNAYGTTVSGYGSAGGSASASVTVTIPALPSYTVAYNANGGSGAPGSQTKWYGKTLKLSSTKPTRTGYTFQGWATSSGGSVAYAAGANYTSNASATLYAVWKANTWTISYNANGGSGAPAAQTKIYGQTLTLSSTKPTRTNYNFLGWSTSSSATSAKYAAGGTFTTNANVTLYAVWQLAYVKPRITNLAASRCNSAGTYTEGGTYAKITFNWATDKTVSSVKIVCNGTTTTVSGQSGTSGSVSQVVGANVLSTENSYTVTVTVTDSGGSTSSSTTLPPLDYIIDFSPQGGIGIGTVAPNSERVDINRNTYVNDHDLEVINGSFRARGGSSLYGPTYVHGAVVQDYNAGGIQFENSSGNAFVFARNSTVTQGSIVIESPLIVTKRTDQRTHIDLSNNAAITGKTTSGSAVSLLRINTSNRVELNWTSGGLKGRVMKKIWSGNAAPGSTITVSEMPYYNLFAFEHSANGSLILVTRMKNLDADAYTGIGGYAGGSAATTASVQCRTTGSTTRVEITYAKVHALGASATNTNIVGIYGIL